MEVEAGEGHERGGEIEMEGREVLGASRAC